MLLYVEKLSEYAHAVAGQGKQHVGLPGNSSIVAQNRPSMTMVCQFGKLGTCRQAIDIHPPSLGNIFSSRNGAMQLPKKGDTVVLAMVYVRNAEC